MGLPKRLTAIMQCALAAGWTQDETTEGHPRFSPPKGLTDPKTGRQAAPVTFAKTPSDNRGDKNAIAHLRRLGVSVPHKGYTPPKADRQKEKGD